MERPGWGGAILGTIRADATSKSVVTVGRRLQTVSTLVAVAVVAVVLAGCDAARPPSVSASGSIGSTTTAASTTDATPTTIAPDNRPVTPTPSELEPTTDPTTKPTPTTLPARAVSATLVVPSTTMRTGSAMIGHVVVVNHTGRALTLPGCGLGFAVQLTNRTHPLDAGWTAPACGRGWTLAAGRTVYPVTIAATYSECGGYGPDSLSLPGQPVESIPACPSPYQVPVAQTTNECGPGGPESISSPGQPAWSIPACPPSEDLLPALPPGRYEATTEFENQEFPAPTPVEVTVTP